MPDGFRVLESASDYRVDEAGNFRITEQFVEVFSDTSATSSLVTVGTSKQLALSVLNGAGTLTSVGGVRLGADSQLTNNSVLDVVGARKCYGTFDKLGAGSVSASATRIQSGFVASTGAGTVASESGIKIPATSALSGTSSVGAIMSLLQYGQVTSQEVIYDRITESGDTRILEDSVSVRITDTVNQNWMTGDIQASAQHLLFSSDLYIKQEDYWHQATPFVKHNGEWKAPVTIHKKTGNIWKRIY